MVGMAAAGLADSHGLHGILDTIGHDEAWRIGQPGANSTEGRYYPVTTQTTQDDPFSQ